MDEESLETFRHALLDRGRALLQKRRQARAAEEKLLIERQPSWEDLAANQTAAALLEGLSETDRIAFVRIQSSLERIARGSYVSCCVVCKGPIDNERLREMPEADQCGGCRDTVGAK